jgi:hypothetical protein
LPAQPAGGGRPATTRSETPVAPARAAATAAVPSVLASSTSTTEKAPG